MSSRRSDLAAALLIAVATLMLWASAPMNGDFSYSDAPRHALNGVFVKDLIAAFPWRDPTGYAMQYYIQYPALTILFYPPLFYLISAPFYAVFGVSEATAITVVLLHYFAFALGLYVLARRWLGIPVACAVGLLGVAAPELALWGRQVMLELPNLAFVVWALIALRQHGATGRPGPLYLGTFLLLCALYTKLNAVFLVPVAAAMLWAARGNVIWRDRHVWFVAALFIIGMVPLGLLTVRFGQMNVRQAVDQSLASAARPGAEGWLWYLTQLPRQLWWPTLVAACLWPFTLLLPGRRNKLDAADIVLLLGWLVVGYLFLSAIDLKSPRYSTLILPPLLILAGLAIDRLVAGATAAVMGFGLVLTTAAYTWIYVPVPTIAGYRYAAQRVAQVAPRNGVVLFSGLRDGSFIFNMRTNTNRSDIFTIRADKLLLDIAVERAFGVRQRSLSDQEISEMLDRYGISYVVAQSDFWTDLDVMARLDAVLHSSQFSEIARIPVVTNVPFEDKEIHIYRNTHAISATARDLRLDLPIIGRSVEGVVGRRR